MENHGDSADISAVTTLVGGIEELFMRLPVALYRTAPDGRLLAANPALAELLGYDTVDELSEDAADISEFYVEGARRLTWLDRISEDGVVRDFDIELIRRDGTTVWVQSTARAAFDDDGSLMYCEGALVDMTEMVKAKKARDEFVATVSHELRNPMSVILGMAYELATDYEDFSEEERREIAAVVAEQADDASWIIEDLLVAYREDVSHFPVLREPFDIVAEVSRVFEGVDQPIEFEVKDNVTRAVGDARRTRQILRNLVNNAVRYGGDEIRVVTRQGSQAGSVDIMVCDNGPPLDPDEAERIFESYERGSGLLDARSVGLGLSVARKLANLMGGSLVYSHDGEYSCFVVSLPAET